MQPKSQGLKSKKINSKKKSFLYLIVFSLTTNLLIHFKTL